METNRRDACDGTQKRKEGFMNRLEDVINMKRLQELLGKKEEKKEISPIYWVIAIGLIIAVAAGIAYAVYRYFTPDYLEDFDDEFEEDFDDEFFDDEEESDETAPEADEEKTTEE